MKAQKSRFLTTLLTNQPDAWLLRLGLLFGLLFCVFVPYGAGFDEEMHAVRIYDLSGFNFIPNRPLSEGNYTFTEFYSLSYQRRPIQSPALDQFSAPYFTTRGDINQLSPGFTRSTYFPVTFLPQAAIAGLAWRVLDLPIFPVVIIMRGLGLVLYLLAAFLTIRLLPFGKWVFLTLALSPMALFQAATLNGDGITIAAGFLFIGLVLNTVALPAPIIPKRYRELSLATLLLGCVKPGTALLLSLLVLLTSRRRWTKAGLVWVLGGTVLSILITAVWADMVVLDTTLGQSTITRMDQIQLVLANLGDFIPMFIRGLFLSIATYYRDWVGVYGYWVGLVPTAVYWLYPIAIVTAFLAETKYRLITAKQRWLLVLTGLFMLAGIASVKFVYAYQPGVQILGAQGRYFLPFAPAVLLGLSAWLSLTKQINEWMRRILPAAVFLTVLVYAIGLYSTYYSYCPPAIFNAEPCRLPVYKNIALEHLPKLRLDSRMVVEQSFIPRCDRINTLELRAADVTGSQYLNLELLDFQDKLLALTQGTNRQGEWLIFSLPDTAVTAGQPYQFLVAWAGQSDAAAPTLYGLDEKTYPDGAAEVRGKLAPDVSSLYFRYTCAP